MVEIEKPRIECVENPGDGSYGKYVVEPLERGYGTTLGNSLRRILLSSLPGTAVTSIKIAGVQHEFSTIPGVKEDVTEIVLNVKSIIAKLHSEGVKTVYIEASGECEVTAGDIKADGGASRDAFLMQFQADILDREVRRPAIRETTALGAAYLAGLAAGVWSGTGELRRLWRCDTAFSPAMPPEQRERLLEQWHRAVGRSRDWAR